MGKVSGMFSKGYGVFMKMFLSHHLTLEVEWSSSSSHDLGGFLTLDSLDAFRSVHLPSFGLRIRKL